MKCGPLNRLFFGPNRVFVKLFLVFIFVLVIFENLSGLNGLMTKLGFTHMTQNCLNMAILTIFDRKSSISVKNDISVWLLNPLWTMFPVWERENHVVFQASYLKNG